MFIHHRAEPDACVCEVGEHVGVTCVDNELDVRGYIEFFCEVPKGLYACAVFRVTCPTQEDKLYRRRTGGIGWVIS